MSIESGQSIYEAFESQLKTLCLHEFPCGLGSWRTDENSLANTQFGVTLKDYGVEKEHGERLEELITSKFSPYSVDYSWSDEAQNLRETAVQKPWVINKQFILTHFKTLRIVDKNINEVDDRLLEFPNLKELTLSANKLESVNSNHLPVKLEVLELVANNISDLEPLCDNPPPNLQHLGLGHNVISNIYDYLTERYWPNLLSLDLSHNNLCGLPEVVQQLSSLTKLRNLSLIANPLALIPGYRGFVVDSLKHLLILDDLRISADEKHHFKGLARRKDLIQDETKLTLEVKQLNGVPMPIEMQGTEDLPEYPIIERRYYMEFTFLEDKLRIEEHSKESEEKAKRLEESVQEGELTENTTAEGVTPVDETAIITITGPKEETDNPEPKSESASEAPSCCSEHETAPAYVQYCTDKLAWNDEGLQFEYKLELIYENLPALKEGLKEGIDVVIKEDKVLCTPLDETLCDGRTSASSKRGSNKEKRKESAKTEKPKEQKDKGKKKKKEPEVELARSVPEVTILAKYHVDLVDFVEGEHVYSKECVFQLEEGPEVEKEPEEEVNMAKDKKKRKDSGKTKKGKVEKEKGTKKTPIKGEKKDSKKRPVSGKSHQSEECEEEQQALVPIASNISVQLLEWKTAQDALT
ncbi:leucine-rich repeat-containing protein 43-like [Antedon mediterranea]|uniref:leucine-rich repeat-containing protein 43-like n=1 Tax=Antedon mediterranea TaxID=105859 RepID=UPI003AF9F77E